MRRHDGAEGEATATQARARARGARTCGRALSRARRRIGEERAQGTLEYAIVTVALLVIVTTLALLWRAGERGALVALAGEAASHQLDGWGALDIALF